MRDQIHATKKNHAKTSKEREMEKVKQGDTVKVHYQGTLDDGSVFDSDCA